MNQRYAEIAAVLAQIRSRWRRVQVLRGVARAAAAAAVVLLLAAGAWLIAGAGNRALLIIAAIALPGLAAAIVWGLRRALARASDRQIARLTEERCPELEDRLASAVEFGRDDQPAASPLREFLLADAARRAAGIEPARVIAPAAIRRAASWSAAAVVLLVAAVVLVRTPAERAYDLALLKLFPSHLTLHVAPGNVRLRDGEPLKIGATIPERHGGVTPVLEYGAGDRWRRVAMKPDGRSGRFAFAFPAVSSDFTYRVSAGPAASDQYAVTVLHLPHVTRIDLRYEYPAGLGLAPRTDEDAGDIYAPPGTRVRLHITTDKPVTTAALTLDNGRRLALTSSTPKSLDGELEVQQDGSYRVALDDTDGLRNPGDTEYFIRMLAHRPPEVRIVRPASDQQVTPLEEVGIQAHADAEYGIGRFDLVYSVRGGPKKVVPFTRQRGSEGGVDGRAGLSLEDLHVKPGDLISYYAEAHDETRSGAAGGARSDIFFLEVQPFEEQFTAAQSQTQGLAGGGDRSIEELTDAQKDIVVATWKLDRRNAAAGRQSAQDIKSVAKAQTALRTRVQEQMAQFNAASMRDPRQAPGTGAEGGALAEANGAMGKAAEAMGKAATSLDALKTADALPREMDALDQLLKAQAQVHERQVTQQAAGAGNGDYRRNLDLSTLFDQQLQKLQQTNYETPAASTPPKEAAADRAIDRIRQLAERQDELARQQQELANQRARMTPEEMKRQLERLTRDQAELQRQAQDLERELARRQGARSPGSREQGSQQNGQSQKGRESESQQAGTGQQQGGGQSSGQMNAASKAMTAAAGDLRHQNPSQASAEAARAADALRQLARRMENGPGTDETWRAIGDMRLESSELADAERQVASELRQMDRNRKGSQPGSAARDELRRIGGEKERLADRAQQLEQGIRRLLDESKQAKGDPSRQQALASAADELARQRLAARMRQSADEFGKGAGGAGGDQKSLSARAEAEQQLAQGLDRVSGALASAGANDSPDARKLADQLARVQQLRQQLNRVQQQMEQLARQSQGASPRSPAGSAGRQGGEGAGQNGQEAGRQMASLQQMRDDLMKTLQQSQDLLRQSESQQSAGPAGIGFTPEGQGMVLSAPGTEAFKQDFARWQSLQRNANAALERLETSLSQKLQQQLGKDRLAAGGEDRAPAAYQSLVDRYFQAIAQKKRPQH